MAAVALVLRIGLPRLRDVPWLIVLGFFAIVLHHVALNFGQRWISPGASSVLAQSAPLFSTLIARVFLKETVSGWRWLWVAVGFLGALVVVISDKGLAGFRPQGLLVLLAAFSWSVYFALQKHYSNRYSPLTLVCYTIWSGTLLLGIFPSALAYLFWAFVLARAEVSRVVGVMYLIPPVAMVMAAVVLGSTVSMGVMAGAAIILASVMAMSRVR